MIGIPDSERNFLRNTFKLSAYRTHTCTSVLNSGSGQTMRADADDLEAIAQQLSVNNRIDDQPVRRWLTLLPQFTPDFTEFIGLNTLK